tara:strand:- start:2521 stop:3000 length:480 start_codon:yes stop_codon:yes gene_type:complete
MNSSDNAQITDQLPITVNLPDMENKDYFVEKIEGLFKDVADAVNAKDGGFNLLKERGTGSQFYNKDNEGPLRNVYRKTFDLVSLSGGSVGGSATIQFAHEITNLRESAGILANCTSVDGRFFTASYPDVYLDRTSVVFTNPYTEELSQCDVTANYLKEV